MDEMSFYKTEKFKRLESKWYKKLEQSGFVEIENKKNDTDYLKVWHSQYFQCKYTPDAFLRKQEYYHMTREFLHIHEFDSDKEKMIWEMHSQGLSLRKISTALRSKVCRIYKTIRSLSKKMGEHFGNK